MVAVVEKRYQVIKPKHGFYKGECLDTDIAPTIDTGVGCWHTLIGDNLVVEPNFEQDEWDMLGTMYELSKTYRIRKLTPNECGRLMGVKSEDCAKLAKNQSTSSQYHLYGDSIATTCLMAIFGELFNIDYETKINELVEELKQ